MVTKVVIDEDRDPSRPLGRHIHFDDKSRDYPVRPMLAGPGAPLVSKLWSRQTKPFDQGHLWNARTKQYVSLGACTGMGAVGMAATTPYRMEARHYSARLAVQVYMIASAIDDFGGQYPPTDTGSSVLAAQKALQQLGLSSGYVWCFSTDDVLQTLSTVGPVEVGFNWYSDFDRPDEHGLVKLTPNGRIRGGHAFELHGNDVEHEQVIAMQSWGLGWGVRGQFRFSYADLDRLMHEDGEAATMLRKAA